MSTSRFIQASASVFAGLMFVGCATTSAADPAVASADSTEFAKPTAEEVALINRAEPLAQVKFWNQQYNVHPVDLDIALAFSRSLRQINSFERAAEVANLAVVSHPESAEMFIELGRAQASQGKSREALRAYSRALTIDPDDPYPYAAVGIILDREGQHENAQKAYAEALVRNPDRPATVANYGMSLALSGNLSEAEDKLRKASGYPGASAKIRQNFALVLGLQGKFDEARTVAAQDAPDGIAERNTDFLAQMIGGNPQLQTISGVAAAQDAPRAAPSDSVQTVALAEPVAASTPPSNASDAAPRRPRRARRGTLVTDGLD